MQMDRRAFALALVGLPMALACNVVDDEPNDVDVGDTGVADQRACAEAAASFFEDWCLPGYEGEVFVDGGGGTVFVIDDPAAGVGLGVGLVVQFGGEAGADWVGYGVTENPDCRYGCFLPRCPDGQEGCYARAPTIGLCGSYCVEMVDQQACNELQATCMASDPAAGGTGDGGGLDETGGSDGGADETTGGETTGGVTDEPFDCSQWHPEAVDQPDAGGPFRVPQTLVDQLVRNSAEPLVECDGMRLRQGRDGRWVISKLRNSGLLGALGLRVGDELRGIDDVELDSLDAVVRILGWFVTEDGGPRRIDADHPGFSLRVRRGRRDFVRELRVVPSEIASLEGGGARP